ncbi:TAP-like protein-domain-containing protein [Microdochium trichocladiopsis]|uniref:TAP-like protein-domain-containing protein n=1 Tax=Microdochium trichocladiopsis TaxID=1682393 RepID=A0A9P8Y470_9PEZI|nr:TAP-like protein-domain-containing protein [Microdochium trichocladiopsis]KAH7027290.1 TAP-like protein-domain-containing protein [Microdochium trichocladiopsis]
METRYPPDVKTPTALDARPFPQQTTQRASRLRIVVAGGLLYAAAVHGFASLYGPTQSSLGRLRGELWGSAGGEGASIKSEETVEGEGGFDWSKITPSEDFEFHQCFGEYQCARLSVPLNWNSTSRSVRERLALAVIKYPARVPVTDPRYAGPILTNPGGPGGSGITQTLKTGKHYQVIADSPRDPGAVADDTNSEDKYYDIISFDPRGVGATTPRMTCFPDPIAFGNWKVEQPSPFLLEASEFAFHQSWARSIAFGEACAQDRGSGKPNIIYYMNTPQVVEDMVAIVDKHAQWREREVERILLSSPLRTTMSSSQQAKIRLRTAARENKKELVNYAGISYGTLLGQTFATMHPDRVGRVILDAVVDAADYYALGWTTNLQDTDRILVAWSDYCQASGSVEKCPFYVDTAPSGYFPARVAYATTKFLESPKTLPLRDNGPWVFGYHDAMNYLMRSLYQPFAKAEDIIQVLNWKEGDAAAVEKAMAWKANSIPAKPSQKCIDAGPWSEACINEQGSDFSGTGILCSDGPDQSNVTKAEFREYMHLLQSQSDVMGTFWAEIRMSCIGWKGRPAWEFSDTIGAQTANPILFISNTHDPVTPIRNGRAASKLFPGSALLHQNSEGHGFYRSPSIASAKKVRAYWQRGELPGPDDTPTEPDVLPFIGCVNEETKCKDRSDEDEALWEALHAMAISLS